MKAPARLMMGASLLLFATLGVGVKFASLHDSAGEIAFYRSPTET